jgi:hypothetical protein
MKLDDLVFHARMSEFDSYYEAMPKADFFPGAILDTNILISLSYEIKSKHEEVIALGTKPPSWSV